MYKHISGKFPIWRDAEMLVAGLEVGEAVARFPRYHKYSLGAELRRNAMNIVLSPIHYQQQIEAMYAVRMAISTLKNRELTYIHLAKPAG